VAIVAKIVAKKKYSIGPKSLVLLRICGRKKTLSATMATIIGHNGHNENSE
jgi:hypothetical protein